MFESESGVSMLGVLGGMGPLATVDFLEKLVRCTPAERDQDHPQVVVFSNPGIPDRVGPILGESDESPLPALVDAARRLQSFGATMLVMPCHTAHFWYAEIAESVSIQMLHIADATCMRILAAAGTARSAGSVGAGPPAGHAATVGLLATRATLHAGIYQRRFQQSGVPFILPDEDAMNRCVLPAIAAVKRDALADAGRLMTRALYKLVDGGAELLVLACTELPLALSGIDPDLRRRCIDPTEALARACVEALQKESSRKGS